MTGLIYVILISMWGVVLVPRWLRHHDESRRRRETTRIQRTLAPDEVPLYQDEDRSQSWSAYAKSLTQIDPSVFLAQLRAPRSPHAQRRRTIVLALSGSFAITMLGAMIGLVPGILTVFLGLVLAGYLSAMFMQMRQWDSRSSGQAIVNGEARNDIRSWTPTAPVAGVRIVSGTEATGSSWAPQATTLPTYVSKSKASKIPRRIDLTREATGAGMVDAARQQQASPRLQQQFDREFAVLAPDEEPEIDAYANYDASHDQWYRRAVNE